MVQRENGRGGRRKRLTARDWSEAALTAMGEGGLAAVAIEPIAKRLGSTKGSFYWHFADREALIEAALALWEESTTDQVLAAADAEPDPKRRLRAIVKSVPAAVGGDPVEVFLLASAGHPLVAPTIQRVTERRIGFMTQIFRELGFPEDEARHRGLLIYTTHLGHIQLLHAAPQVLPAEGEDLRRYMETLLTTMVHRA